MIFSSGGSLTTFSLIGISIIFALSYNILLGQTGMLSFGHAVYYGLGGFLVDPRHQHHRRQQAADPAAVGSAGRRPDRACSSLSLLGWVSTQRSGTAFAMISLGVAELVASSALILRTFFGGEAGISANRTKLFRRVRLEFRAADPDLLSGRVLDADLRSIAMYALTRTPLGRMCNAVRDNPERVQFIGYDPHVVRYLAFCFAGFFAGIAGALAAINFEIANSAYLGAVQSGTVLFSTYIGGVGYLHRPDRRRDIRHRAVARPERRDHGLAALFRPDLHRRRDVRAGRHHRPSDDAPAADPGRNAGQGDAVLSGRADADAGDGRWPHARDRDGRASHRAIRATTRTSKLFGMQLQCGKPDDVDCWRRFLSSADFSSRARPGGGSRAPGTTR